MSLLQRALRQTPPQCPERLDELSALIDPAWIEQALMVSGKASIRRRKPMEVRVGGRMRRFITSLPDHRTHPAHALAELYRQRWEIELGFREIKQSLQEGQPVLRSKQPELVRQELWGVLIAYTLLRRWMREMAAHVKVEPQRISFHTASYAIVNLLAAPSLASAGTLPKQLQALLAQSHHFVLPPRRTERSFPRVVKNRANKFPTKEMPVSVN